MAIPTFQMVWKKIIEDLKKRDRISTLVRKIVNEIISVTIDGIEFRSSLTDKSRIVPKEQFNEVWNELVSRGRYVAKEHKAYTHSQIICAVYVELGITKPSFNPLIIYLKRD